MLNAVAEDHVQADEHQLRCGLDGEAHQVAALAEDRAREEGQQVWARRDHAIRFLNEHVEQCTCDPRCAVPDAEEQACAFAAMSERDRSTCMRSIMYALATKPGVENELKTAHSALGKRARLDDNEPKYPSAFFVIRGKRVYRSIFGGIVQVHPRTVAKYAAEVAKARTLELMDPEKRGNRKGQLSQQSIIALAFLVRYGEMNAMPCPTGRGSTDETVVQYLPSSTTINEVYTEYMTQWHSISPCIADRVKQPPTQPLTTNSFVRVWRERLPTLRFFRVGSDFCDTCTKLNHSISNCTDKESRHCFQQFRLLHRENAKQEFMLYKTFLEAAGDGGDCDYTHLTFDFAEKVLLPHYLR